MIYRAPEYTKKFKCIADKCHDSCCIGWEIGVDENSLKKYASLGGALGEDIRTSLTQDGCFRLCEDGRCPHLLQNGLCRLICEAGDALLCEICREHPRYYNTVGALCEWGLSLACESAAELILAENALPCALYEYEEKGENEECDEALLSLLLMQREQMLSFISDEGIDIETLLFSLEKWADALQNHIDNADICNHSFAFSDFSRANGAFLNAERLDQYKALILSLEVLDEKWKKRCEKITLTAIPEERAPLLRRLLAYFLYRYMIYATYDGDPAGRIGLSIFCAVWITLLCESEGLFGASAVSAAKDFSKEVECSEDNLCAVQDAFSAFG